MPQATAVCPTQQELIDAMRPAYEKYLPSIFSFLREKMLAAAREGKDCSCTFYIHEMPLHPSAACHRGERDDKVWLDIGKDFFDTFYKPCIEKWLKDPIYVDWSDLQVNGSAAIIWKTEAME